MRKSDEEILKCISLVLPELTDEQKQQSYCIMFGMKLANKTNEETSKKIEKELA